MQRPRKTGTLWVTVQTWDVGSPELSLITGGLDVVNKIQSINIWPFDTRASLILDCYSLEHWLPFFARTIRSPAETNISGCLFSPGLFVPPRKRIGNEYLWLPFSARTIRSPAETNKERISLDRTSDRPRMKKWRRKLVSTGWRRVPRAHLCFTMVEGSNRRREGGDVSRGFRVSRATDWQGPIGFFVASPFPTWRRTHFPSTLNNCHYG